MSEVAHGLAHNGEGFKQRGRPASQPCDVDIRSSLEKLVNTSRDVLVGKEHNEVALGSRIGKATKNANESYRERDAGQQGLKELKLEKMSSRLIFDRLCMLNIKSAMIL